MASNPINHAGQEQAATKPHKQVVTPMPASVAAVSTLPANVKDAPELARAKLALNTAETQYQAAQGIEEEAAHALQEARAEIARSAGNFKLPCYISKPCSNLWRASPAHLLEYTPPYFCIKFLVNILYCSA